MTGTTDWWPFVRNRRAVDWATLARLFRGPLPITGQGGVDPLPAVGALEASYREPDTDWLGRPGTWMAWQARGPTATVVSLDRRLPVRRRSSIEVTCELVGPPGSQVRGQLRLTGSPKTLVIVPLVMLAMAAFVLAVAIGSIASGQLGGVQFLLFVLAWSGFVVLSVAAGLMRIRQGSAALLDDLGRAIGGPVWLGDPSDAHTAR